MKEALFILVVVFVLAALTAVRYRKQISGMIGFARMLKEAKQNITQGSTTRLRPEEKGIPLVNCSKCGVWIPQSKAIKIGDVFVCTEHSASRVNG
jgi:hypothetical protein